MPVSTADPKSHWQHVYTANPVGLWSWRQDEPSLSLKLIEEYAPSRRTRFIDVGAGDSPLLGTLLARGYEQLTGLDVSRAALARLAVSLGPAAAPVTLLTRDLRTAEGLGPFDFWHDRAVFHFLTDEADRRHYVSLAADSVVPGGFALLATFAADGPDHCSGLPVRGYSPEAVAAEFHPRFRPVASAREIHRTPGGVEQPFTYVVLQRA